MALFTVSKESALTEAGNSTRACMSSVFNRLAGNFAPCKCVLNVTRHCTLTIKFDACRASGELMVTVNAEFSG